MALTEQELVTALAETGRAVTPRTLSEWRSGGLLPALASKSRGLRKGKICFWLDDAVFDRAALIHDLLSAGSEKQDVYCLLWLCGFAVPLAQLRRAWASKAKSTAWTCRTQALSRGDSSIRLVASSQPASSERLLSSGLSACADLGEDNEPEIDALVCALGEITPGNGGRTRREPSARTLLQLKLLWFALRSSDLPTVATDREMLEAQQRTSEVLRRLHSRRRDASGPSLGIADLAPIDEARSIGAPLFSIVLAHVRSGQQAALDALFGTRPERGNQQVMAPERPAPALASV